MNLILAGPRRTGKTSVCQAALVRAARRGCYTARVDLFRISDTAELAEALALAVIVNPQRALDLALELPERVAVADGRRLILFFDEFQELASERRPYGDPDLVTKRMRAVFQQSSSVSYLFAGSLEHVMRDLFAPSQRAFSGFGGFHPLRSIAAQDWLDGIAERFAADDCMMAPAALARIIDSGAGHPRATMRIAQQTHLVSIQLGYYSETV